VLHAASARKNSCATILSSPTKSLCSNFKSSESTVIVDLSFHLFCVVAAVNSQGKWNVIYNEILACFTMMKSIVITHELNSTHYLHNHL
jgi:hypothetical protein